MLLRLNGILCIAVPPEMGRKGGLASGATQSGDEAPKPRRGARARSSTEARLLRLPRSRTADTTPYTFAARGALRAL